MPSHELAVRYSCRLFQELLNAKSHREMVETLRRECEKDCIQPTMWDQVTTEAIYTFDTTIKHFFENLEDKHQ